MDTAAIDSDVTERIYRDLAENLEFNLYRCLDAVDTSVGQWLRVA